MLIMQLIKIIFITKDISNIRKILISYINNYVRIILIIISNNIRNVSKYIRVYNWP